ncbi:MAG: 2-oxo-4-hydroxy-4-carboxy-5-ureidoimidazoline decarboxylase [Gammaproteobacteria bacterium]|nr:2-oxo-4-hydroxy-4-carboxy-5-ureidoimidazoline decarboxylase [Gammaproteobacteria bacterium]NIR88822.1 2-oxo-4-hydroxy-4-carboxy-5-ureidoimidazoline decarboxylase [Gammaproteobacteria bacterium]NIU06426.1 2-oxo-4-hydroxy-4-carboxy-5-ureidoimidazoline decarboxylase [Gammaproteobacteria bacterium]NIV53318.1 2-oxo-4-hydroxy-4-carboxy-5-ureidoimidazoline decarboxylase [Gammaproteobacteria bacterium]NIV74037.1 2-oxo-4-hydroxy-4-carboxy-5-ureidoimidazoline decarboxylase [Gammaproteobacteria bacteri
MDAVARMGRESFARTFGEVFEHSPWVAEAAWSAGPFRDLDALHAAMVDAVRRAGRERQLALIHAHPELAGKPAEGAALAEDSRREQAGAGLDRLSAEEYRRFQAVNRAYRDKFGFPFILAVKGLGKERILEAFAERLANPPDAEFERALAEIAKIARFRLAELVQA